MDSTSPVLKKTKAKAFVDYVIDRLQVDSGFGAALRRADNLATEYQAWEHLAPWCDLDKPWDRLPYATIAASLARAKPEKDGHLGIGKCIASCYEDGHNSDPAKAKLRRLIACESIEEACRILRPILSLIKSKGKPICYSDLLNDLFYFGEKQRLRWATDFYGRRQDDARDHT